MNGLALYLRYAAASVRMQMLYPTSFILLGITQLAGTAISFLGVAALFDRFGALSGWRLPEVAVFFGVVNLAFGIADMIARGFDIFGPQYVKTGDFDRLLVRPRPTALQVLGHELRLTRIGRLAQAGLVLVLALPVARSSYAPDQIAALLGAIAGGVALFVAILILQATLSFWTVESLEVVNALTYGGVEAGQYPLDIYPKAFARFLILVVPLGCATYYPVLHVLGRSDPMGAPAALLPYAPVLSVVFLAVSLMAWRLGVRRYRSTGS